MMVLSALRPEADLPEFLSHRARSSSLRRLGADIVAGTAIAVSAVLWRPTGALIVAGIGVCFFAYGLWGVLDRAKSLAATAKRPYVEGVLEAICALVAAAGIVAASAALLGVWALALGTWIS